MEFEAFPNISRLAGCNMNITQKIHGSNAQILVFSNKEFLEIIDSMPNEVRAAELAIEYPGKTLVFQYLQDFSNRASVLSESIEVKAGSRTRWITPLDDNYGFAQYVEANKQEIIEKLGIGRHFGEWAGPGINSGEGLTQKTFILFDWWKFPPERPLPPQMAVVPVLYNGAVDFSKIDEAMSDLKANGSKLVPGFTRPEGIVIQTLGTRVKKVFEAEETGWTKTSGVKNSTPKPKVDLSYLLQPIRMEKLLSKDERYLKDYPKSLASICKDYVADLEREGQLVGEPEVVIGIKKNLGGQLFPFAKAMVEKQLEMQGGQL